MKLKHLKGNIYAIKGRAVTNTFGTPGITANSLFIDDHKKAIIDPSSNRDLLMELGKKYSVDYCFLTHAHLDHTCSLSCFPKSKIFVHKEENVSLNGVAYTLLYTRHFLYFLIELWKNRLFRFRVDECFIDRQTFQVGDTLLQVIHAPGHTRGHSFFYFPDARILYSGDFDLSVMGPSYSYTDSSIEDMVSTARRVMDLPIDIWVSGHWRYVVTDDIKNKIKNFIDQVDARDQKILAYLKTPGSFFSMGAKGLVLPVSIVKGSWLMRAMEKKMILMHLNRLEQQGRVKKLSLGRWVKQ